ncbi:MAG: hypothetical protein ACREAA_16705 [Candidatus Polarisedimenticolia bacterium]
MLRHGYARLILVLATLVSTLVPARAATLPELPRVFLDTTYAPPIGGMTIFVGTGGDLQAALNAAQPGDIVEMQAGAVFTGNFTLPSKVGTAWIHIRSSAHANLPAPGMRVFPAHAQLMPRVISPNGAPAVRTATAAHNYRFVGVEITASGADPSSPDFSNNNVIYLEAPGGQTSLSQVPGDIVFDRCYIHGNPGGNVRRGIAMNSARTAVVDSYLSDFHEVGVDSQAIAGWNGPGPFKIVNSYLEGAGENVMFGGADPTIANLVPSDIEISGNHVSKPLSWRIGHPTYAGRPWSIKNLLELKNARRVLIEGNVLEHSWEHAQNGFAVLFTVRNQDGGASWSAVQDVTFRRNILRHAAGGINIHGTDNGAPSQQTRRILIQDNLLVDISAANWGGPGRLFQFLTYPGIQTGIMDLTIEHVTGFPDVATAVTGYNLSQLNTAFVFRNNITPKRTYGFAGATTLTSMLGTPNMSEGNVPLDTFYVAPVFAGNVLTGSASSAWSAYPGNFFPSSDGAVGFENLAAGNYRLADSSPYRNAGTDGRDPGADIDAVEAATAGAVPGTGDLDADGVPNAMDCAPLDPTAAAIPGQADLTFTGAAALGWTGLSEAGSGTTYDVVRGALDQLPAGSGPSETCLANNLPGTSLSDAALPVPGKGFFYLVRGSNACGPGTYGTQSSGAQRLSPTCP